MSKKTNTERKQELVSKWEEIFEKPISEVLSPEGFERFWDPETPVAEAAIVLDIATIFECVPHLIEEIEEEEEAEGKVLIMEIATNKVLSEKFGCVEDALEFIKDICFDTEYKRTDFQILVEM